MQEIEFTKELDEMNDAELRATLREFRTEYSDAKTDYDELQDTVEEYKAEKEDAEEKAEVVDDLHPKFASMFAEMKDLDEEMVEDKFTTDELVEELEEADAFALSLPADDDTDENEDDESKFSEKEQKSRNSEDGKTDYSDRIDRFFEEKKMVRTY